MTAMVSPLLPITYNLCLLAVIIYFQLFCFTNAIRLVYSTSKVNKKRRFGITDNNYVADQQHSAHSIVCYQTDQLKLNDAMLISSKLLHV